VQSEMRVFMSDELKANLFAAYDAVQQLWPAPVEDLYVPTRFGVTHVLANGSPSSPSVVLFHPGGGNATIWYKNVGPLSRHFRTYAVDFIGEMNKSIPVRPIGCQQDFSDWIADLFAGLGIRKTSIVGNSNGGYFALNAAINMPQLFDKVVLISPAATFTRMPKWWLNLLVPAHILAPFLHATWLVRRAYRWLWRDFAMDDPYAHLHHLSKVAGYPRYRPTRNKVFPHKFSDQELKRVSMPVLLLIGDHEVIYNPALVFRRATRLVSHIETRLIPNANHCAQYTAPEQVNREILDFMSR
jgi:pimeloyl-ACP methyl ester carboxylesterase